MQLLQKVGDEWEEEVRREPSTPMPTGTLPCLLLAQTLPVLPGLAAPLLRPLSPAVPGATLKPLGAPQLLPGELSPLLGVRDLTQFLSHLSQTNSMLVSCCDSLIWVFWSLELPQSTWLSHLLVFQSLAGQGCAGESWGESWFAS